MDIESITVASALPANRLPRSQASGSVFEAQLQKTASASSAQAEIRQAAEDLEAFMLTQMLAQMRKTLPGDSLFGHSQTQALYESMLDESLGRQLAQGRGMGLATMLYQQMQPTANTLTETEG
jgi:flagellar protein FlgJ